jgi:murein DD-endopeptidase MepM/ murein hydrolase activator NlpD
MRHRNSKYIVLPLLLIVILLGGYWLLGSALDIGKPEIRIHPDVGMIGRQSVIEVTFSDRGSSLRDTSITITQGEKTQTIHSVQYPQKGTRDKMVAVTIDPFNMKMQDGPATLNIKAVDHSLFKNQTLLSRPLTIDMHPPQIMQVNAQNIISPGGSCVTLYGISKPVVATGVQVDDRHFPAYRTQISGKPFYIAYFSLPVEARQGITSIKLVARDQAGNESTVALPHLIKKMAVRADRMNLSDPFLQQKMPEFQMSNPDLRGKTPVETFIHINHVMRQDNFKTIQSLTPKTEARQLWEGTFLRMKNAAPMAMYGERRTYVYEGKVVGESLHEGVDLASVQHAPIEAANHGIVVFAGPLGIYGNTIIIDHGFGLFTLYAHLSAIDAKAGKAVKKGEVIGRSGMTGLAGGDHLHFSVIVGGQFVNPIEWWDPHWIADNVTRKIAMAN